MDLIFKPFHKKVPAGSYKLLSYNLCTGPLHANCMDWLFSKYTPCSQHIPSALFWFVWLMLLPNRRVCRAIPLVTLPDSSMRCDLTTPGTNYSPSPQEFFFHSNNYYILLDTTYVGPHLISELQST